MNISRGGVDMRSFFCPELKVGHLNLEPYRGVNGSPDKPGGLSIQLCKSEKKEFYIRYSS